MKTFRHVITPVVLLLLISAHAPSLQADAPAPRQSQQNYEVRFLTSMIDHHHMAVMMGMLCEGRTVHEELAELCEEMVAAQTAEIEMMHMWLEDWYGITYHPEMKPSHERMMDHLASLDGEEFEIAFMTMMIRHHAQAVREGTHCVRKAYHHHLIEMCEDIIATQLAEIEQMETWLCEWYEICK